jgi:outer membrane murein-binding lipoprotein Lpp
VEIRDLLLSDKSKWSFTDFTLGGVQSDGLGDVTAMWSAVLHEIVDAADPKPKVAPSQLLRFKRWFKEAVDEPVDVDGLDEASKEGSKGGDAELAGDGEVMGKKKAGTAAKEAAGLFSGTLAIDLQEQRASNQGQLVYAALALFLGRAPTRAECKATEYCSHPGSSDLIRKSAKIIGSQTFVEVIAKCRTSGSVQPLASFLGRLVDSLAGCADDYTGYASTAAAQIGLWFSKTRDTADSDMVVVEYCDSYVMQHYIGRFLPKRCDYELLMLCNKLHKTEGVGVGGVCSPSILDGIAAMTAQVSELTSAVTRQAARLDQLGNRMDGLNSKVEAVGEAAGVVSGKNKWLKCDKCNKLGHKKADCTEP